MTKFDKALILINLTLFGIAGIQFYEPKAQVQVGAANHCQYPLRPRHPDGTCNNEDPCDPMTLSVPGLWGDCAEPEVEKVDLPLIPEGGK